ncbi:MAG: HD domain-containing protein [Deltaproteobacteria bacterium]|jgi:putative hydrolase of HD superfamily|nr:HD domain-containing protein [Deltaproteobacteria bacterium]
MDFNRLSDFLFEALSLKRTPRTGYQFLGKGKENVAQHSFGVSVISYTLGALARTQGIELNMERLLTLSIFHDLAEARTGDLNYMNKRYVTSFENEAYSDAILGLPFEDSLASIRKEWDESLTMEAQLARDADQLDMLAELARMSAHGFHNADEWIKYAKMRLKTDIAKGLCEALVLRDPDGWWFLKKDEYWVNPQREKDPKD